MPKLTYPPDNCQQQAADMVRRQGVLCGRLWACRDRQLENAEVYALDGQAWIVGLQRCGHMDWFDFRRVTRENQTWNVAPAGLVRVGC